MYTKKQSLLFEHKHFYGREGDAWFGSFAYGPLGAPFNMTSTRSGESLPEWQRLIREGKDATTTLEGVKYEFHALRSGDAGYTMSYNFSGTMYSCRDYFRGYFHVSDRVPSGINLAPLDEAYVKASVAWHKKVKATYETMSGPTFLGELRESIRMIKRPLASLSMLTGKHLDRIGRVKSLMKGQYNTRTRKKMLREYQRAISDSWLETVYGWKPLVNDFQAGLDVVRRFVGDEEHNLSHIKASGLSEASSTSIYPDSFPGYHKLRITILHSDSRRVILRSAIRSSLGTGANVSSIDRLKQLLGFNLEGFVATAWELIPYSFIVDYFTNTGAVLEAMTTRTSDVVWTNRTNWGRRLTYVNCDMDVAAIKSAVVDNGLIFGTASGHYGASWISRTTVDRKQTGLPATPSFSLRIPKELQWVNMLALISSKHSATRGLPK